MNSRIQIMLESRHLEEAAPAVGEVEGLWRKAGQTFASSVISELDPAAQFTLTYQAALQASMAVLRSAGLRVRGEAHHHHTFAGVAALDLSEISEAARDLNLIRRKRHDAIYDWETHLEAKHVEEIRSAARRLFAHAEPWLRRDHPGIEPLPRGLA